MLEAGRRGRDPAIDELPPVRGEEPRGGPGRSEGAGAFRREAERFQRAEDPREARLRRLRVGVNGDLGVLRRLVRIVDAREVLDLPRERLLVEPFGIAVGERGDRALAIDLDEIANLGALLVADGAV